MQLLLLLLLLLHELDLLEVAQNVDEVRQLLAGLLRLAGGLELLHALRSRRDAMSDQTKHQR